MANRVKVILKIMSVKGPWNAGHRQGQEFDWSKESTLGIPKNGRVLYPSVFYAAYPCWRVQRFKGEFPW